MGGKPDALIAGQNVEISNSLTLQRRPGLVPYGVSNIPSPTNFFAWELTTTADILLIIDTETGGGDNQAGSNGAVFRYSPTSSGIYFNKANLSKQTNFISVANTMYMGDGVDLLKVIGPNLLLQSNTFGSGSGTLFTIQSPWIDQNIFALTSGASDPVGGTAAVQLAWGTTGSTAYLEQDVVPNYTPIAYNTFTFSIWIKQISGAEDVDLQIRDQSGIIATKTVTLTTEWVQYQVTGTMNGSSNTVNVRLTNPSTTDTIAIYGAQLEVGGPATTTQITTNLPQGVFLWGIQAPNTAPNVSVSPNVIGTSWQPNHAYTSAILALTSVDNHVGSSAVYHGKIVNGAGNFYAGYEFTVQGFLNSVNDGIFTCTASTATTLTLGNGAATTETNPGTATPTFRLTSVQPGVQSAVYTGTIYGGVAIGYAGYAFTIQGFSNPGNNGTFFCTASNNTSITLLNISAVNEIDSFPFAQALLLGQAITDSNGNLEVATSSGTSGSTVPAWSTGLGGTTSDGTQNIFVVQTDSNSTTSSSASVTLPANVTAGNSILVFMVVNRNSSATAVATDTQGNTYVPIAGITSGPFSIYLAWAQNVTGGASVTFTATCSGAGAVWIGVVESSPLNNLDAENSNQANSISSGSSVFQTGLVSTTQIDDLLISFSAIIAGNHASSSSSNPANFMSMLDASGINMQQGNATIAVAFEFLLTKQNINPQWSVNFGAGGSRELGITAAFNAASTTTLIWTNYGSIGLTAIIGFTYYYAFMNSETEHVSNVSPISSSTGAIAGQSVTITGAGMQTTPSGPYGQDPQVDTIALFRNTDGGPFWYQVATFPNPGTASGPGTWSYTDVTPSNKLNTSIFAPIGLLNSLPPAGLVNMEYFEGRLFGSVKNILYYNTAADNASLLSVTQNGVPAESWVASNNIPFNATIVRSVAVGGGLIVCTTLDTWFVTGINILQGGFNPQKALAKHGVRFYNAVDLDGSTVYIYTSDRESLMINPNSGSVEVGYPIGDTLEDTFSPMNTYIARHVAGSRDNAVYLADGSTGWYRLNPNQVGASMSGEATPVWSPKADFTGSIGGIGAIASIETAPGTIQLLVGQKGGGPTPPPLTAGIQNTRVTMTAAQYKASYATPFQLLPAPGPNHAIVPISMLTEVNPVTTQYTLNSDIFVGFGTDQSDIVDHGQMIFPFYRPQQGNTAPAIMLNTTTGSGQGGGAFATASHVVNQPLYWVSNNPNVGTDPGDSTFTINIQWIEVDVTTGAIIGGTGQSVWQSVTNLNASQIDPSGPITQLIPAPGANKIIMPIGLLYWVHGYQADPSTPELIGTRGVIDIANGDFSLPLPTGLINQPLSFDPSVPTVGYGSTSVEIDEASLGGGVDGGGTSLTVYVQYVIVDVTTGDLVQTGISGTDLAPSYTTLSANQLKNAGSTPIQLIPAGGPDTIVLPIGYVVLSNYVTTPYSPATDGGFPNPAIGPGNIAIDWADGVPSLLNDRFYMAPNFVPVGTKLFTQAFDQIAVGAPTGEDQTLITYPDNTVNSPVYWADGSDVPSSPMDSTGVAMVQYVLVSTTQGTPVVTSGSPLLVRDLDVFSDGGIPYNWDATIGSILLTTPGKLAEVDSITTEMNNKGNGITASQCTVAVLLDEISGTFESLPMSVNDPPGEIPSETVLSNRFYLSQGDDCPVCRHIQIQIAGEIFSGLPQTSKDELLALTVRGALVSEQV